MKHIYRSLSIIALIMAFIAQPALAEEWSFDWPVSATADKTDGIVNGFYNFGSQMDSDITSQTRQLAGKTWTLEFQKGTKITYLASSGLAIGASGGFSSFFTLSSPDFEGKVTSVKVETRSKNETALLSVTVGDQSYICGGENSVSVTSQSTTPTEYVFTPSAEAAEGVVSIHMDLSNPTTNAYVKKITVVTEDKVYTVETPTFTPEPGVYDNPVEISIATAEESLVKYTTDGSNPQLSESSLVYTSPFTLNETATVKAIALIGEESSAVAEGKYCIRKSPNLSFFKESIDIELLDEGFADLLNPYNVTPVKYSSSNVNVAWADSKGLIYTYHEGQATITATFAGDDNYLPQTVSMTVNVIAKEPLAGLTVTPGSGTYEGPLEVAVTVSDPRAQTIWYHVGDKAADLDDLGLLDCGQYEINPSTELTLTLDRDCVLSVQAMGVNVWSEPQFIKYQIHTPLHADFKANTDSYDVIYHNGFDTAQEMATWETSQGSTWQLMSGTVYDGVPDFNAINPESKNSLFHYYANTRDMAVISSPTMKIPENASVRFWAVFNPVWIYYGNLQLYVCEDAEGAVPVKIWDAFLTSQEAATDDIKWTQYYESLTAFAGKKVFFSFAYSLTDGDVVMIDDFEIVTEGKSDKIEINVGDSVSFTDLSTGCPTSWKWEFPGTEAETSTEQNPSVVYTTPGIYDVTLTVGREGESDTMVKTAYITVKGIAPTASIVIPENSYYSPEAGLFVPINTDITFADASEGAPTEWKWELPGTDIKTAYSKDVTVKYTEEGMYDVDLTVSNDFGTSSTYLHGVKAGGESLVWNIPTEDNGDLEMIELGYYGWYGGTNWIGMSAFAEAFDAPAQKAEISAVNIYFASAFSISPDTPINVSIALPDADGAPGEVVGSTFLPASQLVDAYETYNDPTTFTFDTPVEIDSPFFVTVSGFPNDFSWETYEEDCVVMYALRRNSGNTAWHLLEEWDDYGEPAGESVWMEQTDDPASFAIAPLLKYSDIDTAVETFASEIDTTAEYWTIDGIKADAKSLAPGLYIRRCGNKTTKVMVR